MLFEKMATQGAAEDRFRDLLRLTSQEDSGTVQNFKMII